MQTQKPLKCISHVRWRGVLAEFLSTLFLVLLGCMSCIPIPGIDTTFYGPFAFAMIVLINVQIFGPISGAYMNPAVTLVAVIWGKITPVEGIVYVLSECMGAILGYGILVQLSPINLVKDGVCVTRPYPGASLIQTVIIEVVLTGMLALVVCSVWDPINEKRQDSIPIKLGLTVLGVILMGGPLTGASVNPARSLGPAVWTNHWTAHWTYWVGPLLGSSLATVLYKYVFLQTGDTDTQ